MDDRERFFLIHIMKTAGYSLVSMLKRDVFDEAEVYPTDADRGFGFAPYLSLDYLRFVSEERQHCRLFAGHFPYAAKSLFGGRTRTLAFFRDPVERVLSHLRYARARNPEHRGWPLHRIYEDISESYIRNLQTRTFAIESIDGMETLFRPMPIDESVLDRAMKVVEQLDFIGLVEDFQGSLESMENTFGWSFGEQERVNDSPKNPPGDHLRARIARDNEADARFYAHVRELYRARQSR